MADQINTTAPQADNSGGNMVAIVAIVILVGLAIVFVVYALPYFQKPPETQTPQGTNVQIQLPPNNQPAPSPSPAPAPSPSPY